MGIYGCNKTISSDRENVDILILRKKKENLERVAENSI